MIIGIGMDIVDIERIRKVFADRGDKFLKKVYTDHELEYSNHFPDPYIHLSARFSAKEAYYKCVGRGVLRFHEIEVRNEATGKPYIELLGETQKQWVELGSPKILVTLTHTATVAAATVILEK